MPQKLCIFLTGGGAYAPYATCMATSRAAAVDVVYRRPIGAVVTTASSALTTNNVHTRLD